MIPQPSKLPKRCPFCYGYIGKNRTQFKVKSFVERNFDAQTGNYSAITNEGYELFCLTCKEHIRPEDIKESDMLGEGDD